MSKKDALGLALPDFATPVGLDTTAMQSLTEPEWESLLSRLSRVNKATGWLIGDALNFGEAKKYGARKNAVAITGLSLATLHKYASVARKFESCRRLQHLSYSHHQEVVALDEQEQDRWLRIAQDRDLSSNELRSAIKAELNGEQVIEQDEEAMQGEYPALVKVREAKRLLKDAYKLIREAADSEGGAFLKPDILPRHFNAIRDHLNEAAPSGDCPKCGGKGCITCKSKGYVSRGVLKGIMESTKCTS